MAGWYHGLDGHEFEQAPGLRDGQGSLAGCSPWRHKESGTTERLTDWLQGIVWFTSVMVGIYVGYMGVDLFLVFLLQDGVITSR